MIEAFSLTLQSSGSAANKVRAAIENLLTEFGVARNSRKNNKLHRLSLDARIAKAKNKLAQNSLRMNLKSYGSPISIASTTLEINFEELEKLVTERFLDYRN